jgi:hypothetical protein
MMLTVKSPAEVGAAVLERFTKANEMRHERAMTLRGAISRLIAERPTLLAKQIQHLLDLKSLGRTDPPHVRTIQGHLKALRKTSAFR